MLPDWVWGKALAAKNKICDFLVFSDNLLQAFLLFIIVCALCKFINALIMSRMEHTFQRMSKSQVLHSFISFPVLCY